MAAEEAEEYRAAVAEVCRLWQNSLQQPEEIGVVVLNRRVRGMGAIRDFCVSHAVRSGYDSIIMSDDDIIPHHSANPEQTLHYVRNNERAIGIGCVVSQHDLLLGGEAWRLKESDPIFCSSGYGFRMFALDLAKVEEVGGFDPELDVCFEDAELMRQGVAEQSYSWWLDPGLRAVPLGKRFAPGGIADLAGSTEARASRTEVCHRLVHERWPAFMSSPGKAPRFAWKKFLDEYLPGWRNEAW